MYEDPDTGLSVMTRQHHINRGFCCGNRCRHCPYLHVNVRKITPEANEIDLSGGGGKGRTEPGSYPITFKTGKEPAPAARPLQRSKVYTKRGDGGTSTIITNISSPDRRSRISKADMVFDALGSVDELNSTVGWCVSQPAADAVGRPALAALQSKLPLQLRKVQRRLIVLGSVIASPGAVTVSATEIRGWVTEVEAEIDAYDALLPELTAFILPGDPKYPQSAALHMCRSVCRRAERSVIAFRDGLTPEEAAKVPSDAAAAMDAAIAYLNRMSDFFFQAARCAANGEDMLAIDVSP